MAAQRHEFGMVGLGATGRDLLLNMAGHGFPLVGYDKDPGKVGALQTESAESDMHGVATIEEFAGLPRKPRAIMMLVPAGSPVDSVVSDLLTRLEEGDLIVDAGNSCFKDLNLRARSRVAKGIQFLGVGVSGGEEGARHGPSLMPGGPKEAYERVRPLLEAVAAKVNGDPCAAYLGPGSAGHFVKTGFTTAMGCFDGYRGAWLTANPIQAQRDYFGTHRCERVDGNRTFHTDWTKG